jgi:hypothetical protein
MILGSNNGDANKYRVSAQDYKSRMHSDSIRFPIITWSAQQKVSNVYSAHPSNIYIESATGDLIIETDTPVAEVIYIKGSTASGNAAYLPITVIVCGGESIALAQPSHAIF